MRNKGETLPNLPMDDFLFPSAPGDAIRVSTRLIADKFGKRHDNILRAVQGAECTDEFARLNFEVSNYMDSTGKSNREYLVTRDGFMYLVMGFTGREAARWKEAFIAAYNKLERRLAYLEIKYQQLVEANHLNEMDALAEASTDMKRGDIWEISMEDARQLVTSYNASY